MEARNRLIVGMPVDEVMKLAKAEVWTLFRMPPQIREFMQQTTSQPWVDEPAEYQEILNSLFLE
jgi:hypothetical protein